MADADGAEIMLCACYSCCAILEFCRATILCCALIDLCCCDKRNNAEDQGYYTHLIFTPMHSFQKSNQRKSNFLS